MNQLRYKQEYIQWFLNFRFKKVRAARLLLKICQNPQLLEQVVFTDDITDKDNAIMVSAKGSDTFPFICRVQGMYYNLLQDAYKALLDLSASDNIYVSLVYPTRPTLPGEEVSNPEDVDDEMVQNLQHIWQNLARQEILHEVDKALDRKDQDAFHRLIQKLRRIES